MRWPWLMIVPIVALTGAGIFAATQLDTNAGTETLVSKGSSEFRATQDFHEKFGDEPVIVLVKEDLRKLVLTRDLEPLFELEDVCAALLDRPDLYFVEAAGGLLPVARDERHRGAFAEELHHGGDACSREA